MDRALIVEDDHDQANLAARLVRLRDFDAIVAETGEAGLQLARQLQPAVVLLDLMLPDTSGFDVCRALRGDRATVQTPIVMLTALSDDENRTQGYRVGANAYVTKPYTADELFQAIATARAWQETLRKDRVEGEIHVELNSEITFLLEVNDFLTDLMTATPLSHEQIMHLRQAVMEIGQNAIEWGNRHQVEELVQITYRVCSDRLEVVVRDEGAGFNPQNLPHAASADDPLSHLDVRAKMGLREGGFGLVIARGMVDELKYNDQGNQVTLIKHFHPRSQASRGSPKRGSQP